MKNNILNLEDGQLYLNLSIPLNETYSSYIEALDALYSTLDYSAFYRKGRRGRPYCVRPKKMMVLLIYSYMNGTFSSREIEKLMKRDCVCMKILGEDKIPDHSTIDRFLHNNHEAIMKQSVFKLKELGELDGHTVFQDGTKIESVASRYSFVWLSSCEKSLAKAFETDEDSTFMRMKEDHMRNGQLKPAYNMQNLVQNGYIIASGAFMDRTDYYTMIPMLEKLEEEGIEYDSYCADSGYDVKDNYKWLEEHGKRAYIKPQYHEENKKRKRRNNPSLKCNYSYDEAKNIFKCMRGHKLFYVTDVKKGQVYEAKRGCKSCPLRKKCMLSGTSKYDYKRLVIDIEAEKFRRQSESMITSDKGIEVRVNRSIQAEGSFALLKAAFGYRRFRTHGIGNIESEWMLLCMAGNALRYSRRLANKRAGTPFWFKIEEKKAC